MLLLYFQNKFYLLFPLLSPTVVPASRGGEWWMQKVHFSHLSICVNRHIHHLAEVLPVQGNGSLTGGFKTSHQHWVHVAVPRTSSFPSQRVTSAHGIFIVDRKTYACNWRRTQMLKKAWSSKRLEPIAASLFRNCGCAAAEHRHASHPCNNFLISRVAQKRDICGGQRMKSMDWKTKSCTHPNPSFCSDCISKWHNTILILMRFSLHLSALPAVTAWQTTEAWGEPPQAAWISSSLWEHFDTGSYTFEMSIPCALLWLQLFWELL